jgi:hypothetical protein
MVTAVIDADLILYKAASAGEQRVIEVTHKASGRKQEFANRTAFKQFLTEKPKFTLEDFEIVDIQRPPSVDVCYSNAKSMIESMCEVVGATKYELYVGKGDSFRKSFDLPTQYKNGRNKMLKPVHLNDVKQYLIHSYGAKQVEVIEADDMLSIRAYEGYLEFRESGKDEDKVVQITSDKDAKQCQGWLYNHDTSTQAIWIEGYGSLWREEKGKVNGNGRAWLYFQSLAGDPVDTYKPSELSGTKFGDVSAFEALKDCKDDRDALKVLATQYKTWYPEPVTYMTWDGREVTKDYIELVDMYFNTARMWRWMDDKVNLKDVFKTHGIISMRDAGKK